MTDGPQTDNGYTRIANEILEDLLAGDFSKRELLVLLSIIRKTYGFNKVSDEISSSQIAKMTGLAREHVARTISSLIKRGVVLKQSQRRCNVLSYQKKASLHVPKQHMCQNSHKTSAKTVTNPSAKMAHTKDISKRQIKDKAILPNWLPSEAWTEWLQYKKERRKPMTPMTQKKQWRELERYMADGHLPADVINQSITQGWTGLFPLKKEHVNGNSKQTPQQQVADAYAKSLGGRQHEARGRIVDEDGNDVRPEVDKQLWPGR